MVIDCFGDGEEQEHREWVGKNFKFATVRYKWEYKLVYHYTDSSDIEFLNQLGLEYWENYAVVRSSDETCFFLKRPKVET